MREFIEDLRKHHLDELTSVYYQRVMALDVPLMKLFSHLPEQHLLEMTKVGLDQFLGELAEGKAFERAAENLKKWEADELPGMSKDDVEPTDLVLIGAAQKAAILVFLPRYTQDPDEMMGIVLELEDFYVRSQADAFKVFTRIREESAARIARKENELLTANAQRILDLNDDLLIQKREAQEANRLKSEFLANMSHELRTPLNSILGYTELVLKSKNPPIDERNRTNLLVVKKNGKHLLSLINDVLDLAKIESGRTSIFVEPLDANAFFQGLYNTASPMAREKGLELTLEIPKDFGTIITDETKVRQIVLNLLSNAIKFTQAGGVLLRVSAQGPDRWTAEVQDTGVGIAPEHQQLIFEEFRQVDSSSTRKAGGTGLGLAIARKLALMLGGDLTLHSEAGQGSTFKLEQPREAQGDRAPMPAAQAIVPTAEVPLLDGKLPVVTIDDDPEMLHLIAERLKDSPYVAVPASSGESGLKLVRELKPFAITLDIILPTKDGWSVLRELKADPTTADIPVLILSVADSKVLGYTLGAAGYLTKPVDGRELLMTLDRFGSDAKDGKGYVLVVEDDGDTRGLYREILDAEGVRFAEAVDGHEGITAAAKEAPALVILDLMMPNMDGFEVLAWLRSRPETRDVPVIVVTARSLTVDDRQRLAQAQSVIYKSDLNETALVDELRGLLAKGNQVAGGMR